MKKLEFFGVDGGNFEQIINEYGLYNLSDVLRKIPSEDLEKHVLVEIDGKVMKVATNFWRQAEEMRFLIEANPDVTFTFHGDSLNNMLFNRGLTARVVYDSENNIGVEPPTAGPGLTM